MNDADRGSLVCSSQDPYHSSSFTDYSDHGSEASNVSHIIECRFHVNEFSQLKVSFLNSCTFSKCCHICCIPVTYCAWWMIYLLWGVFG